MTSQHLMHSV